MNRGTISAWCGVDVKRRVSDGGGSVCFVGREGLYLRFSELVLVCDSRFGSIPFGVGVERYGAALGGAGIRCGAPVRYDGKQLRLSDGGPVLILKEREPPPGTEAPSGWEERARKALRKSGRGAIKGLVLAESDGIWSRMARDHADALLSVVRNADGAGIRCCLEQLIGLGPGLTPAMDDWLVGLLYYWLRKGKDAQAPGLPLLREGICALAPGRTTEVSAAFLTSVAAGQAFEILDRALAGNFEAETGGLLSVGGSSGADILTGMVSAAERNL